MISIDSIDRPTLECSYWAIEQFHGNIAISLKREMYTKTSYCGAPDFWWSGRSVQWPFAHICNISCISRIKSRYTKHFQTKIKTLLWLRGCRLEYKRNDVIHYKHYKFFPARVARHCIKTKKAKLVWQVSALNQTLNAIFPTHNAIRRLKHQTRAQQHTGNIFGALIKSTQKQAYHHYSN